jgi:MoxR-like ATPase
MDKAKNGIRERLLAAEQQLNEAFVNRREAVRMILLAHLCGEHYLLVGTPGVAKTALARAWAQHITGGRFFTTLLGAFSSPEKVFGPLSIAAFQKGEYRVVRDGKLADVEFAFLDEYFKANEGCLNELLTVLNEREFEGERVPLMTCGTATNWPEIENRTENVAALYDRILLRAVVEDVYDEADVVELLDRIEKVETYRPATTVDLAELRQAMDGVRRVSISEPIRKLLHNVRQRLAVRMVGDQERPGIPISGRRIGALQRVLKASAWLAGRAEVAAADFEVLDYGLWNDRKDIEQVRAVLGALDAELVAKLIERIDNVRREYDQVKRSGFGATRVNELAQKIEQIARETRAELEQPVYTASGRKTVGKAIAPLKQAFIELESHVQENQAADGGAR